MDDLKHLHYCPPNVTFSQIWVNHGLSQCFMDTISSSVMFGFIFLFGTIELLMYRKHGTRINPNPPSKLYIFQLLLIVIMILLVLVRFVLQGFVYDDHHIYGFMVSIQNGWEKSSCNKKSLIIRLFSRFIIYDLDNVNVFQRYWFLVFLVFNC